MSDHDDDAADPIVVVGIGEMGGVFSRAFLRAGHPVHPVTRSMPMSIVSARVPEPELTLVTVGEADLASVLDGLPGPWRSRAGLIQNELLPRDWQSAGLQDPTVAVVWFEKKPGRGVKVIIPTPVGGPQARLVCDALDGIGIAAAPVPDGATLQWELVRKNLYILTANIAGLVTGGTVMDLWDNHRDLALRVANEVLSIQEALVGAELDGEGLIAAMAAAFAADPEHGATGRSAPSRLTRALAHAAEAGLSVPTLTEIGQRGSPPPSL